MLIGNLYQSTKKFRTLLFLIKTATATGVWMDKQIQCQTVRIHRFFADLLDTVVLNMLHMKNRVISQRPKRKLQIIGEVVVPVTSPKEPLSRISAAVRQILSWST